MGNYKSFGDTKFVPNLPKVSGGGQFGAGGVEWGKQQMEPPRESGFDL